MSFPFHKMHGTANDFVVVYRSALPPDASPELAIAVCDRRRGVGADGILVIGDATDTTVGSMTVWNSDGSVASMCGNGLRCVAVRLREDRRWGEGPQRISTDSGDVEAQFTDRGVRVVLTTPSIGAPRVVETTHGAIRGVDVDMGNPHFVVFEEDAPPSDLAVWGASLASHPSFPTGANVERVSVHPEHLDMRVWERGAGETLACGSGACAAFVAARTAGRIESDSVDVHLRGGVLRIEWPGDGPAALEGPAGTVYDGVWRR